MNSIATPKTIPCMIIVVQLLNENNSCNKNNNNGLTKITVKLIANTTFLGKALILSTINITTLRFLNDKSYFLLIQHSYRL